jgi:hypothetical protein
LTKQAERGVFFTEAALSICILTIVILMLLPVIPHVYRERQVIQQKTEALQLLRYHLVRWKASPESIPEPVSSYPFDLKWEKKTGKEAILSVSWTYDNRHYQLRSEARK